MKDRKEWLALKKANQNFDRGRKALLRRIAKLCALKKSDIGKRDTRSCIGTIEDEGRTPYDYTKKVRGKLD